MSPSESLSPAEKQAYELITSRDGLVQSQLWKSLEADSRTGSRLAKSLQEKGLIERKATTHNGQRTYWLTPSDGQQPPDTRTAGPQEPPEDERSDREERALALIQDRGGMYQSEFWKELDVSSRTGSRIATNLAAKGDIRRVEAIHDSQRTYFLGPTKKDLDFSLLMAGETISPFISTDGELDPIESEEFTQWILALARDQQS